MDSPWGVDLVIFDGEELVYGRHPETQGEYFLGSKEFARAYVEDVDGRGNSGRDVAGLVLDMVGGTQAPDQPGAQQPEPRPQPRARRLGRRRQVDARASSSAWAGRSSTITWQSTTPASPRSTSSTSTTPTGTRPTTFPKTARRRAWPRWGRSSQPGWLSRTPEPVVDCLEKDPSGPVRPRPQRLALAADGLQVEGQHRQVQAEPLEGIPGQ